MAIQIKSRERRKERRKEKPWQRETK